MAKYERYAEYKDSGVEWLGDIPSDWKAIRVKYIADTVSTGGTPKESSSFTLDPEVCWFSPGDFHDGQLLRQANKYVTWKSINVKDSKIYKENSVLVIGIGATLGKVAHCSTPFSCNQQINVITPNRSISSFFLMYSLLVQNEQMSISSNASTIGIMNQEKTKDLFLTLPDRIEQDIIVSFLDHETAQIDTLIDKQQTLIQLLKEKRQAVISHAVTKGLNPDAPMKDSGVEWLGEVPEHWVIVKLKRLVSFSQGVQVDLGLQKHEEFDKSVKFLRIENYTQGSSDYRFINPILSQGKLVSRDELVMVRYGASAGYVGRGLEGALANNLFKISPTTNTITNNFLSSFLKNSYNYLQKEMSGSAMPALNFSMVEDLIITLPSISEQKQIADYLDKMQSYFDYLTASAEQAIQLMQERRTALISAAVTGKIDVRGWRAPNVEAL